MHHGDAERGEASILTWAEFKAGLKRQFYLENSEELAMKKLRSLKHTGSIKEYVKQYSTLMLEISDMPEKSRLLYFMDGLQRWAEQELKRRNVQDLEQAISVAESLIEFQRETRRDKPAKKGSSDKGKGGGAKPNTGGSKSFKNDKPRDKGKSDAHPKGNRGCFLCGGPHFARECPQRQKLTALVSACEGTSGEETRMGSL